MRIKIIIFSSVIIIVSLFIVLYIIPNKIGHVDKKEEKARVKLEYIETFLKNYYVENKRYPQSLSTLIIWLKRKEPNNSTSFDYLLFDPWDAPYNYRCPGTHNKDSYDLWSYGADKLPGGDHENNDITNW